MIMGSIPKRTRSCKKSKNVDFEEQGNRICSLPVGVLCHILSFLPTKYAVRTSILSRRWRDIWTFVPNLEFLHHMTYEILHPTTDVVEEHRSMDFVDRVLILHNAADIEKFHLDCDDHGNYNPYRFNSWICYAVKHSVQQLYLDVSRRQTIELPLNLFNSLKLRDLKLRGFFSFHFPVPVLLPSLKFLHLDRLKFVSDDSMKTLLSGCPLLEELEILDIEGDEMKTFNICSSTLKKLKFRVPYNSVENQLQGIVIRAPLLESLHISDFSSGNHDVGELPALVEADIDLSPVTFSIAERLLKKIYRVKRLKLSCFNFTVPANDQLVFHNLVHLKVSFFGGWKDMHYLLEKAPKLNVLALKIKFPHPWIQLCENVPKCFSSSLEAIEFRRFRGTNGEMKVIEYFLKNAMVLKKLTIVSSIDGMDKKLTVLQKLLVLRRGSNECQVAFY